MQGCMQATESGESNKSRTARAARVRKACAEGRSRPTADRFACAAVTADWAATTAAAGLRGAAGSNAPAAAALRVRTKGEAPRGFR